MLDVAIIGGGLCGLTLAKRLHDRGLGFGLYEARTRFGGRILSHECRVSGMDIDLGPTWFWPDTQPAMTLWVNQLGLVSFPQHDDGTAFVLSATDKPPARLENQTIHAGARRLAGGMAALVRALIALLPQERLHSAHNLCSVCDRGDHVELTFLRDGETVTVTAKHAVLAMPPRLVEEHVCFLPQLREPLLAVMRETPTWMATQAKAVMAYGAMPEFRERCGSGNAFVHHEQAVLSEIFDACAIQGGKTALGGFLALPPHLRKSFRAGLPLLIASQFAQVFGQGFEQGELHYQDWATEPFTCASQDRKLPVQEDHPHSSHPLLREGNWRGKLFFAGSETADIAPGYLEGALKAALRVERQLLAHYTA
jgi:monoamine oxidase